MVTNGGGIMTHLRYTFHIELDCCTKFNNQQAENKIKDALENIDGIWVNHYIDTKLKSVDLCRCNDLSEEE